MKLDFRQAIMDDAGLLVDIYNASFFSDYQRFGTCSGYGKTFEMMEESIGRTLFYQYMEWCKENGIHNIYIWPDGDTPKRIYGEGGFRIIETRKAGRAVFEADWHSNPEDLKQTGEC